MRDLVWAAKDALEALWSAIFIAFNLIQTGGCTNVSEGAIATPPPRSKIKRTS